MLYEWPDEAVISLEQHDIFAQQIQIIGQHSYDAETYYFVFEGTLNNEMKWFVGEVKKDSKEKKWYATTAIDLDKDVHIKSGTDNYIAGVVPKNQLAQDDELIIETTDSEYNVLVEFGTNH